MKPDLEKIVEHENEHWTKIFQAELNTSTNKKFSSFWWQDYYEQLSSYINKLLADNNFKTILEPGSGSGKATILLDKQFQKALLDISSVALEYADHLANIFNQETPSLIHGDIFAMPFPNESFDFVWNIGVIEHYELEDIRSIMREMIRVCHKNGAIAIGVPNKYSGPILKAMMLKFIKFIPGYKLDTEHFYNTGEIKNILIESAADLQRDISYIHVEHFGNPLIMETPGYIVKTLGKVISQFFPKNRFLILVICKFKYHA